MNVLVELLYSLRQGFLTIFCAMDPFESGKSSIPLLTKMYLNTHTKKKYTDYTSSITMYYKGNQLCSNTFFKVFKNKCTIW